MVIDVYNLKMESKQCKILLQNVFETLLEFYNFSESVLMINLAILSFYPC